MKYLKLYVTILFITITSIIDAQTVTISDMTYISGTPIPIGNTIEIETNGNEVSQGINLWTNSRELTSRIWIDNQKKTFHLSKGDNPVNGITNRIMLFVNYKNIL
ncbi:hypothetical protein [Flavivirga eckloniae]|uniref:Uncharacterized protein n=1 Tax=Flavivirga eckloniae TaxID=1803846 RepID=A0A2K9PNV6_9FLAO|nr:hypothetical protein [Flavivirga eckloniae]AUP78267.1 hypothetical protein C1H87_05875 [Flavivirga eckloniae]